MTAIFFYVLQHRDSQIAYKILMSTKFNFKPFQIRGKNVSNQLRQYGIDKVPTLYFPQKRAKVEGYENIARYLGLDLSVLNQPYREPKRKSKRVKKDKKPKLEAKYQKALKDEFYESESDEFERKFKEAHDSDSFEDKREEEESSFYESQSEEQDSLQRSLEEHPIMSEEEEILSSKESDGESDEVSLEV